MVSVNVGSEGFLIDGGLLPVYSGAVHYWRLERGLWSDILDNVRELGFRMIETYIPWEVHEIERGKFDFGEIDERKDLDAFLSLCEEKGLKILVRPGPHINAELTYWGFPKRILMDPAIQAKTSYGSLLLLKAMPKQFPVPSYASEKFYQEVGVYFDALCPILVKHIHPRGNIVGVQADNETCYFFQKGAYALDYSDDSVALYRRMLREKYGDIGELNAIYQGEYTDFEEVCPPKDFEATAKEDLPFYLDWVEYKEYQIKYALTRISRMLKDRGIVGIPVYHNVASWEQFTPVDLIGIESKQEIDLVGIDLYRNKEDYPVVKRAVKFLVGSSVLPFVPEFGSGIWWGYTYFRRTFTPEEEEFITLSAFMHGLKAVSFYMIVERERWQGSPITRDNRRREDYYRFYRRLNRFLNENNFAKFTKRCDILLLLNYDIGRFASAYSTLNLNFLDVIGVPGEFLVPTVDLGFRHDIVRDCDEWNEGGWYSRVFRELTENHYDFDISDTHLPLERLSRYKLICLPTYDFMDIGLQEKLLDYVKGGGKLVIGPGVPYLDMDMREKAVLGRYLAEPGKEVEVGRGRLLWLQDVRIEKLIQNTGIEREFSSSSREIDLSLHTFGDKRILFAANPTDKAIEADLLYRGELTFRDLWRDEGEITGKDGVRVKMPPYTVKVWEVVSG